MPNVVDADQNADQVRLEIDRIGLPAGVEIGRLVAGTAAIVDLEIVAGARVEQVRDDQEGIAAAKAARVVRVRRR